MDAIFQNLIVLVIEQSPTIATLLFLVVMQQRNLDKCLASVLEVMRDLAANDCDD